MDEKKLLIIHVYGSGRKRKKMEKLTALESLFLESQKEVFHLNSIYEDSMHEKS